MHWTFIKGSLLPQVSSATPWILRWPWPVAFAQWDKCKLEQCLVLLLEISYGNQICQFYYQNQINEWQTLTCTVGSIVIVRCHCTRCIGNLTLISWVVVVIVDHKFIPTHNFLSTIFVYSSNVSRIQIDENVVLLMWEKKDLWFLLLSRFITSFSCFHANHVDLARWWT